MDKNNVFTLLAQLLEQPGGYQIFFQEVVEEVSREKGEALLIRVVPVFQKQKRSFFKKILTKPQNEIVGYGLSIGSSEKIYATAHVLSEVFTTYFYQEAEKKALLLLIPLVRIFIRKRVVISPTILQDIEKRELYWIEKRRLGKQYESIIYFIVLGKLARIDTQRATLQARDIKKLREKLAMQYDHLSTRTSQSFAIHEIFLHDKGTQSLLLPNGDELLTDIDKQKIRNAFLSAPDNPKAFAQKLDLLLSFHIPLLSGLKQEETRLYPHILQGSVFEFIVGLHSVVRWSRQPEEVKDEKTGKKHVVLTFQQSRDAKSVETDLDHTLAMLSMSSKVFTDTTYASLAKELDEKKVMNGIFVHDGGEPFSPFGDVTHADEARWQELRATKDEAESVAYTAWWQKRMRLQGLKEEIMHDLYASFLSDQDGSNKEGIFVKFLDHFQAVAYGIEHIYPYEEVYKSTDRVGDYIHKYALSDLVKIMKVMPSLAQEDVKKFFMDILSFQTIDAAYAEAVRLGRLDKVLAMQLCGEVKNTLVILYESETAKEFLKKWEIQERTNFSMTSATPSSSTDGAM